MGLAYIHSLTFGSACKVDLLSQHWKQRLLDMCRQHQPHSYSLNYNYSVWGSE